MQIRRLETQDLEYANNLRNEFIIYLRQKYPHNMEQQIKWFESTQDIYWLIYDLDLQSLNVVEEMKLGIIGLTSIDLLNRKAELSLITEDYLEEEIADFGLDFVEKYAFEKLSLNKLFITVYEFDELKQKYFGDRYTYKFTIEEDVFYQGRFWGHHYYSLTAKQYFERVNK